MSGFKLWHKRLGHCSHRSIKETIPHVIVLQELENKKLELNLDCQSCIMMVEKATLQLYPKGKSQAARPLKRVHIDLPNVGREM